ncbi:MAG: hypothetical protein KBT88_00495 [Gammaproteobacteria bacterium]|nr:hypothetical protein [Gammaproteobacteria bacterium]MBQ0838231.1 hypothetical protein [Gammaproteobacteria bacterium]
MENSKRLMFVSTLYKALVIVLQEASYLQSLSLAMIDPILGVVLAKKCLIKLLGNGMINLKYLRV